MYRYRSSQKTSPSFKQLRCLLCFLSMVVFKPNEFTPKNNSFFVLILKVSVLFRNRVTCMCFKTDTHTPTCYSKSMDKYLSKVNLQSKFQTIQRLNVWSKQNIKVEKSYGNSSEATPRGDLNQMSEMYRIHYLHFYHCIVVLSPEYYS